MAAPVKRILADIDELLQPIAFDPLTATFTFTLAATDYALRAVVVPLSLRLRYRRRVFACAWCLWNLTVWSASSNKALSTWR